MVTTAQAMAARCPACMSPAGQPCTQPTSTGRKPVTWVHKSREFAYRAGQRQDFFLTFGIEFYDKPHPHWPEGVPPCNPKGWVRITAPSYEQARDIACARFGLEWSTLTPAPNFNRRFFPAGELMVLP